MDKLKQTFSRGKDSKDESEGTQSTPGKLSGQGSHFGSGRQVSSGYTGDDNLGSTTSGFNPNTTTTGATDTSATTPDPALARYTAGPEAGGQSHIGTTGPETADPMNSARGDDGAAAVGSTSTYSTTHLTRGDPTSSVVDPESTDPMTYQKPETSSHGRDAGVPEGSAQTAAARAFSGSNTHGEGMPGAFPTSGYENPYKASNLDPRVDGLPMRSKQDNVPSSTSRTTGSSAAGAGGAGLATAGAASAVSGHDRSRDASGPAPSSLTSTVNPADRSAEYSQSERTKVPDTTASTGMSTQEPTTQVTSPQDPTTQPKQSSGMMGKMLGAVGLGSVGGVGVGAAAASRSGNDSAVETSEGPVTTTGTDKYRSPSQSGPPPEHHRKESIPTTAYPAGPDSARPIAPPVGGTRPSTEQLSSRPEEHSNYGRDAAIGTGVVGAGAGAFGAHEYGKSRAMGDEAPMQTGTFPALTGTSSTVPSQAYGDTGAVPSSTGYGSSGPAQQYGGTSAVPSSTGYGSNAPAQQYGDTRDVPSSTSYGSSGPTQQYNDSPGLHESMHHATTMPVAATTEQRSAVPQEEQRQDHTGRNAALAGAAGVGAVGAGAYGASEYSKDHAEKEAARAAEREKEMAHQQREQAKQAEKEHKAAEKEAEKEQKAHQKEIEKQEKAHQKEVEKQERAQEKEMEQEQKHREKEQAAAAAAAEKERKQRQEFAEKERLRQEEEERKRHEKEFGAAGVGAGAAGVGAAAYAHDKDRPQGTTATEGEPLEKKPSLLKRMFKRKNKDTGEDEEYDPEEEERHTSHRGAAGAGVVGAGTAGAATYAVEHDRETGAPRMSSVDDQPSTKYEEQSGGFIKPSYNPFKKGDPAESARLPGTGDMNHTGRHADRTGESMPYGDETERSHIAGPAAAGTTAATGAGAYESQRGTGHGVTQDTGYGSTQGTGYGSTQGTGYGSTQDTGYGSTQDTGYGSTHGTHDRNRLHKDPPADHPAAMGGEPHESITGLPYDSSKDSGTAARLGEHHHGTGMGQGTSAAKSHEKELQGEEKKSFGEKLKEKLHLGHPEGDAATQK